VEGPQATIGRSPECDVTIDDPFVSKRHLRIIEEVFVEDLSSANGSFLDGHPLTSREPLGSRRLTLGGADIAIEIVPGSAGPAPAGTARDDGAEAELRERVRELETEVERLRAAAAAGAPRPAAQATSAALLEDLVANDFAGRKPLYDASVEEFYVLESFKLLRQVEKVVTRMAGELLEQKVMQTELPGAERNFLELAGRVLALPDSTEPRVELVAYLDELRKWFFVTISAYRRAAVRFSEWLEDELSAPRLTAERPISAIYRVLGLEGIELWRRMRAKLDHLTAEQIEGVMDDLARRAADQMRER